MDLGCGGLGIMSQDLWVLWIQVLTLQLELGCKISGHKQS